MYECLRHQLLDRFLSEYLLINLSELLLVLSSCILVLNFFEALERSEKPIFF